MLLGSDILELDFVLVFTYRKKKKKRQQQNQKSELLKFLILVALIN